MTRKYFLLSNMKLRFFLVSSLLGLFGHAIHAQPKLTYEALDRTNQNPTWFRQTLGVPVAGTDSLDVHTFFRIPYSSILFKKGETDSDGWIADMVITFDVMTASPPSRRNQEPEKTLGRVIWTRDLRPSTFEQTKSGEHFAQGSVSVRIQRQPYRVVPNVQINGLTNTERALPNPEPPPSDISILFLESASDDHRALNYGSNILFGGDADLLLLHTSDSLATIDILAINGPKDSTAVWTGTMNAESAIGSFGGLNDADGFVRVIVTNSGHVRLHRFDLPAKNFENVEHRIIVKRQDRVIHQATFMPRWFNIPTGLLNLDIAIDMMKYALDQDDLREMRRGSAADRERKFNAYWKQRDPTPESAYNELMAEYYARIDHAYKTFSTPEQPGFDSIMGRTWILYGKPLNVERVFPPDGATIVVWEYATRRFIFRATTGFGDFELVSSL